MNIDVILILVFLSLAVISFFLSLSETSIVGLSKIRLRHMVSRGIKHASSTQRLITKLDKLITTILVGNNFVNIAMSAIVTAVFVRLFGYNLGVVLATFATTLFILIICEITPKLLATKYPERIALFTSPLMEGVMKVFAPVVPFFIKTSNFILQILGIKPPKLSPLITEEELRLMIEVGKEEGVLSDQEMKMLHRIFEFGDTQVSTVMVPKDKIIAVDVNATSEQLLNTFVEEGHARLPVYQGSVDNVIGIIYARDLLYILRDKKLFLLPDLIHNAYYVPGALRVSELLKKFQLDKLQIAVVVDERKKTIGIVTLEDLIEEIVGEIDESF